MALKILHVNDHGLSVPRIICSATTAKANGSQVYFCGSSLYSHLDGNSIFDKIFNIGWVNKKWLWLKWRVIKKQLANVLNELRPDIIHSHNIFAAKVVSEFDYPFIMDDHELFSLEFKASLYNKPSRIVPDTQFRLISLMCARWEREVADRAPIITVSQEIANVYKRLTGRVFVVPNFPLSDAVGSEEALLSQATSDNVISTYLGADNEESPHQFRNITGLNDVFRNNTDIGRLIRIGVDQPRDTNIESLGFLPLKEAYQTMQRRCHIGLVPWKPHWFHKYCSPSKAYEYAHCGLFVMVTNKLQEITSTMGPHCDTFYDLPDLAEKLRQFLKNPAMLNDKRQAALGFAKRNLIWEKHEQKVLDAYKCC